jgi:hypothetical protein
MPAKQAKPSGNSWANRIVGDGHAAPADILRNPWNFRRHPKYQQKAMTGTLNELGWIQQVIVNQRTGHMLDGHLRVELAVARNEPTVPVIYVDLSEAEERLALATFDPIGAMAETDTAGLDTLLDGLDAGDADLQSFIDNRLQEPAYVPNLSPSINVPIVDQGDMERAAEELQEQYTSERTLEVLTCPKCLRSFYVDEKAQAPDDTDEDDADD